MHARKERFLRHPVVSRLTHWSIAVSTFALLFSGFGQMPLYKRYMVDRIPGLQWSSQYPVTLTIHYLFAAILVAALTFHVVRHLDLGDWDLAPKKGDVKAALRNYRDHLRRTHEHAPAGKYLPEQRLAYAYMAFMFLLIVASGMIKVVKNLPFVTLPGPWEQVVTFVHNGATILLLLGVVAHLGALFLIRDNRTLVPSMFHGRVPAEYVKTRHRLWYASLVKERHPR